MSLTLGEVRRLLAKFDHLPDDAIFVLAKDGEGSTCSPLAEMKEGMYLAETTWSGEHYMTEERRQSKAHPDDYAEAPDGAVRAVFLWPVN